MTRVSLRFGVLICCAALVCACLAWFSYARWAHSRALSLAVKVCISAAERGDANAELQLSRMYFDGTGVPRDISQALLWAHRAADQGSANAATAIGSWYYHGLGVPRDYSEAFRWYSIAAAKGDAAGDYGVGYMYRHGLGVKQDEQKGLEWVRKSAEQGYARAECELGYLYRKGYGVAQNYAQAAYWYRRAADQGDSEAESGIAFMDYYGYGVPENRREAGLWFHKAAEQGDKYARDTLGIVWLGMTPFQLTFFVLQTVGGLLLLISLFLPIQRRARYRSKTVAWVGGLCLLSSGIWWYEINHYTLRSINRGLNALAISKFILDALIILLLLRIVRGRRRLSYP